MLDAANEFMRIRSPSNAPPVLWCVDLLDAVTLERFDLVRCNRSAASHDNANVPDTALTQHVDHVSEVFVVPSLIGGDRDRVDILLNGGIDDICDTAVVTKMNDFRTLRLQESANHIDRCVMTIEQRGRADETQRTPSTRHRAGIC
jgi:hypothetical protein